MISIVNQTKNKYFRPGTIVNLCSGIRNPMLTYVPVSGNQCKPMPWYPGTNVNLCSVSRKKYILYSGIQKPKVVVFWYP